MLQMPLIFEDEKKLINLISEANETFKIYGEMVVLNLVSNDETFCGYTKD